MTKDQPMTTRTEPKFPCTLTGLLLCVLSAYVVLGMLIVLVKSI